MTPRRKGLLVLLVLLIGVPLSGVAVIGPVELVLWLVLLAAWVVAFVVWGGKTGHASAQ